MLPNTMCFSCSYQVCVDFFREKKKRLQCHVKGSSLIAFNILK